MNPRGRAPLRAFVAMAIGRTDTDQAFDRLIRPALAAANITAVRVDRIEHNDDIDDRIMAELDRCDLVVADLTYARPSVYFEAGYAQRETDVVYTCRRDHLSPRVGDPMGNYRVHFDLQMKNIIPWRGPNDHTFVKTLTRRVRIVVAPMVRQREMESREREATDRFSSLSVERRTERLLELAAATMRAAGFSVMDLDLSLARSDSLAQMLEAMGIINPLKPGKLGRKWDRGGVLRNTIVWAGGSPRKGVFETINNLVAFNQLYSVGPKGAFSKTPTHLVDSVILCSLQRVPKQRVALALPQFHQEAAGTYLLKTHQDWPQRLDRRLAMLVPSRSSWEGRADFSATTRDGMLPIREIYLRKGRLVDEGGRSLAEIVTVPRSVRVDVIDGLTSAERFAAAIKLALSLPSGLLRT